MRVLVVGAGLIGTVYGAHLAAAGCTVSVLSHGPRTGDVAAGGLCARDVLSGGRADAEAVVVPDASGEYDIVLVAVRRDQLASACAGLAVLGGNPAVVFFGNNPAGRAAITGDLPGDVYLGFPGVGGVMTSGTADYVRIRQQPTALPQASDPRLAALESALSSRGFAVQRVADMDGWLAYHAAFVACVAAALYRCGTDPVRLAADRAALTLMCHAITEAFSALRAAARGVPAQPRRAAQPDPQAGCGPLLGTDHALPDGGAVLCRALPARRGGDAGPGPRCGSPDHRLTRTDTAAPAPEPPAVTRRAIAQQRATDRPLGLTTESVAATKQPP